MLAVGGGFFDHLMPESGPVVSRRSSYDEYSVFILYTVLVSNLASFTYCRGRNIENSNLLLIIQCCFNKFSQKSYDFLASAYRTLKIRTSVIFVSTAVKIALLNIWKLGFWPNCGVFNCGFLCFSRVTLPLTVEEVSAHIIITILCRFSMKSSTFSSDYQSNSQCAITMLDKHCYVSNIALCVVND